MRTELPTKKVLIYRLGSLGDTVVALPSFHLIARVFPLAERVLLTNFPVHAKAPAAAAVLGDSGLVHGYMRYTVGTREVGELIRLGREIRRFRPDILIYLMPVRSQQDQRRDRFFFRLAGVRRFVGFQGNHEIQRSFDTATGLHESEAARLARSIRALGDADPNNLDNWNPLLTADEYDVARRELAAVEGMKLIACAPGCKMQVNDWGRANWRDLLARLYQRYPSFGLLMFGAQEDQADCAFAASDWGGVKLNLAGSLAPRQSAAAIAHASVFIGPDSGPKHLAACMGVPCVCVFSARGLPGVWYPPGLRNQIIYHQTECQGCNLETCIEKEKKCILSVTVDEMEAAVLRVLNPLPIYPELPPGKFPVQEVQAD